ncbi:mRNA-decapping enzyme-like protein [Abeliophyllum distichum]|uniref:mRNA-decapping enzyme-like protein n=1 Tax=Abeliophyllum distichum TaxID=126358 RepID=A0ABD1QZU9_9LAMI
MSSPSLIGSHGGGKLTPHLDEQGTKTLNLTVLQRMDPFINEILMTAAHVTFYEFNIDSTQWSRKDVEGSLFVVKRNTQPQFKFVVMNRRSEENLVENLLENFEFEVQLPYLLYRNAAQEVNGIWFYNSHECEEVANLFTRILSAYSKVPPKPQVSSSKSEFEEIEAVPTSSVIEWPLEPSYTASASASASASADLHNDSSFVNFFTRAMHIGNESSKAKNPSLNNLPTVPPSSHVHGVGPSTPTLLVPSLTVSAPLTAASEPSNSGNLVVNLVKPSSFFSPPSTSTYFTPATSSIPTSALQLPLNIQQPHCSSTLQPFQPPTPPTSLIPDSISIPNYEPVSRERVRDALLMLAQDNQFIDMFYKALLKVHRW